MDRLEFIKTASAISLGFTGLQKLMIASSGKREHILKVNDKYGPLLSDPKGILDLPEGFRYSIISRAGDTMTDGLFVPGRPDGMAAFSYGSDKVILIRNHEISDGEKGIRSAFGSSWELRSQVPKEKFYDAGTNGIPADGGTTTLIYDLENDVLEKQFLSLAGTLRNCAGGPTPWNSWLTCEEIVLSSNDKYSKDHGYVFEVPATAKVGLADPKPILDMGRFNHEAVAVDPQSGVIYLTEDAHDGLLYRFIPYNPGKMQDGGRLQALCIRNKQSFDTRNWEETTVRPGDKLEVRWMDLDRIHDEDLRLRGFEQGATRFARGEGMWQGHGSVFFACTNGGDKRCGQIWKYTPSPVEGKTSENESPGTLELFVEPNDSSIVQNADNLTVAPWGDLIVCEDGPDDNFLLGITVNGDVYKIAKNVVSDSELAGATFSPDGSTLFMNIQEDGLTIAITGPWAT